jgi:hypothetical protein
MRPRGFTRHQQPPARATSAYALRRAQAAAAIPSARRALNRNSIHQRWLRKDVKLDNVGNPLRSRSLLIFLYDHFKWVGLARNLQAWTGSHWKRQTRSAAWQCFFCNQGLPFVRTAISDIPIWPLADRNALLTRLAVHSSGRRRRPANIQSQCRASV